MKNWKNKKELRKPQRTASRKLLRGNIKLTQKGMGFLDIDENDSYEIPSNFLNTALHGDLVEVNVLESHAKKKLGEVRKVIKRARTKFVGLVKKDSTGRFFISPDDRKMYTSINLSRTGASKVTEGEKVLVEIENWDNPKVQPFGKILERLGKKGEHETEIKSILLESGFASVFSEQTERAAKAIRQNFEHDLQTELKTRRDVRNIATFTIDPKKAKDFDDAISVRRLAPDRFEIGIHIADVAHYVRENSVLDTEARERATSVYLVDRTIPMLPEILSNEICSLNPNVPRLAFSAIVEVNKNGKILSRWYGRTVIKSQKRFTYRESQEVLDSESGPFITELKILRDVARELKKERIRSGSILFDREEVEIDIDAKGTPTEIRVKPRMETQSIIEEWMLVANRAVAESMSEAVKNKKIAGFAYRIHERPDRSHVIDLANFIKGIGFNLKHERGAVKGVDLNQLFQTISGTDVEDVIKQAALRTMTKAVYTTKNVGHFGLAFGNYTHFTSPIRRYPDIIVHRLLAKKLSGKQVSQKEIANYQKFLEHSSQKEKEAERAERDSIKFKQAEYMQARIGEIYEGIITGVTNWGIYVEELKTKTNGLIRIGDLGSDYFELDEKNYQIVGSKTKKRFRLGDRLKIEVASANPEEKTVDYKLA